MFDSFGMMVWSWYGQEGQEGQDAMDMIDGRTETFYFSQL